MPGRKQAKLSVFFSIHRIHTGEFEGVILFFETFYSGRKVKSTGSTEKTHSALSSLKARRPEVDKKQLMEPGSITMPAY